MSEQICNSDSGRWLMTMREIEHDGDVEFDREHQITPYGNKFCVAGVVVVDTRKEAEALLTEAA